MPPQTPPTSPINPPEDVHQGKKVWILIVLGFILVAINIFFLYQMYFEKRIVEDQFIQTITTDQLTNWKIYKDEEYGFEFKYPNDWRVNEQIVTLFYSETGEAQALKKEEECIKKLVNADSSLCASPYTQDLTFYLSNPDIKLLNEVAIKKTKVGNLVWTLYRSTDNLSYTYKLESKNEIFAFSPKKIDDPIVLNILSTFKFTK